MTGKRAGFDAGEEEKVKKLKPAECSSEGCKGPWRKSRFYAHKFWEEEIAASPRSILDSPRTVLLAQSWKSRDGDKKEMQAGGLPIDCVILRRAMPFAASLTSFEALKCSALAPSAHPSWRTQPCHLFCVFRIGARFSRQRLGLLCLWRERRCLCT